MGRRVERIDGDGAAAKPMLYDRSFVGAVRKRWPKIKENDRAEPQTMTATTTNPMSPLPPAEKIL